MEPDQLFVGWEERGKGERGFWNSGSQSVIARPAASVSPRNLLDT